MCNILKRINVFKPTNRFPTYSSFENFPLKVQILASYSKANNKRYPVLRNPFQMARTNITRGAPVQYSNKRQITTYSYSLMRNVNYIQTGLVLRDFCLRYFALTRPENLQHFSNLRGNFRFNAVCHRQSAAALVQEGSRI